MFLLEEVVYTDIELYGREALGCIVITVNKLIYKSYRFKIKREMQSTGEAEFLVADLACSHFDNVHTDSSSAHDALRKKGKDIYLINGRENLADIVLRERTIYNELRWCSACKNHEIGYEDGLDNVRCTYCRNKMVDNPYAHYYLTPFGKRIKKSSRSTIQLQAKSHTPNHYIGNIFINRKLIYGNHGLYNNRWNPPTRVVLPKRERKGERYANKMRSY